MIKRTDGEKQKYTSIEVMGTRFLENFMNTCYSRLRTVLLNNLMRKSGKV